MSRFGGYGALDRYLGSLDQSVVHEGGGRYVVGDNAMDAEAGCMVIVPAGAGHSFTNAGPSVLRHTAIHEAPARSSTLHPDSTEI